MDASHALLQPHRVPGDVVVDHEPAELEVDALPCCLGRHQHLGRLPEGPLGIDAGAGGVAVADLHAAVDLGDGEAPGFELADQVVEGVLVLGEDQELHLGVAEDPLLGDHVLELGELGLDLAGFEHLSCVDELGEAGDLVPQRGGVDARNHLLQAQHDVLLFVVGEVVEVLGDALEDLLLPVGVRVRKDLLAGCLHALEAAANRVDAGGEPALEHGHGESERPSAC